MPDVAVDSPARNAAEIENGGKSIIAAGVSE